MATADRFHIYRYGIHFTVLSLSRSFSAVALMTPLTDHSTAPLMKSVCTTMISPSFKIAWPFVCFYLFIK